MLMQGHPMLNPMMLNPMMMSMMGMGMNPMNLNQMSSLMHQQQMIIAPGHTTPIPTAPAPVPLMQQTNLPIQSQNTHNGSQSQAPMPLMATAIIPPLLVNNLNGEKKNSQNIHQLDSLDSQTSLISQRPSKIETPPIGTKIIHPDDDISLVIYMKVIIRIDLNKKNVYF